MEAKKRLHLARQVERFLATAPFRHRFVEAVDAIEQNPYLNGSEDYAARPGCRKFRVGRYRIIYSFDKTADVVNILAIDHRKSVYKQ